MPLTAQALSRAARDAAAWSRARTADPLRHARLWDAPSDEPGMVSQRHVLQNLGDMVTVMLGGNGSGKTQAAAQLAVAVALGRGSPVARAWCEANGVDVMRLPRAAVRPRVLFSALTHDDSIRYHRPKVSEYLPAGSAWRNRFAQDEASVVLPGGGIIIFKANRQGREAYQGDAFHLVLLDEEHDEDVYGEALMRTARLAGGFVVMTMTPLKGLTWVSDHFVDPRHPDEAILAERVRRLASGWVRVHNVDGLSNPYIPRATTEAVLAGLSEAERAARRFGRFFRLEGRVYTKLSAALHLHPRPAHLPPGGEVVWGIDFGFRAPFALVVLWWDPRDEVYHVVAEYMRSQTSIREHSRVLAELAALYGLPDFIAADPEDASSRAELADTEATLIPTRAALALPAGHPVRVRAEQNPAAPYALVGEDEMQGLHSSALTINFSTIPAQKAVKAGLMKVNAFIEPDAAGRPHLLVDPSCVQTWTQINNLAWRESRIGEPEEVVKKDDHLPDALRYAIVSHQYNR